jgi:dolichyl-phosphate beta-glucosyltransferase
VCSWLATEGYEAEVIVVDNNSSDATSDVVRGVAQHRRNIRLIHEKRQGKGIAVASGMGFATGQVRLFMDADNSTTIDHFAKAEPFLKQGHDIVIGSLAAKGSRILAGGREPLWRVVLGKLGNLWIQILAVPGIWDTQRGFKVFTAEAAQDIFPRLTVTKWGFDIEVLAIARAHGYRIKEISVTWNNPPETRVNAWTYPKTLWETVTIGINRLTGKYSR